MNELFKPNGDIFFTTIIIAITVGISLYADKNRVFKSKWMFNPYVIETRREYYRFLSSGFIHGGGIHLLFNMLTLFFFARHVELLIYDQIYPGYGSFIFLGIYVLAIIVSSIPAYLKYKGNPGYNALGASGGVSAIVFIFILCFPTAKLGLLFIPVPLPAFVLGIGYLFYSYYMARKGNDNIGHEAHLFGALFGIATTIAFVPNVIPNFFRQLANWGGFF